MAKMRVRLPGLDVTTWSAAPPVREPPTLYGPTLHRGVNRNDSSWDLVRGLEVTEGLSLDDLAALFDAESSGS